MTRRARAAAAADRVEPTGAAVDDMRPPVTGSASFDLQAAIDRRHKLYPGCGGTVEVPLGTQANPVRLTSKARIVDDTAHGNMRGLRILGGAGGVSAFGMSWVRWDGPNTTSVIDLHSRDNTVEGVIFAVKSGVTADCIIDVTKASGAGASICTANTFRRLYMFAGAPYGTIVNGLKFGDLVNGAYPTNVENMILDNCQFYAMTGAGVYVPNDSAQAKNYTLRNCSFAHTAYGIRGTRVHLTAYSCQFSNLTEACVSLGASTHPLVFVNPDVESCARFVSWDVGSAQAQIVVEGGRLDVSYGLAADKEYVRLYGAVSISFNGTEFVSWDVDTEPRIMAYNSYLTAVMFTNSMLPKLAGGVATMVKTPGNSTARLYVTGCKMQTMSSPTTVALDDQRVTMGANSTIVSTWVMQ